jgi:hypothetical protein
MNGEQRPRREIDRILMLEVGLGVILFGLAIYLYWIPAAQEPFLPRWWAVPLLAALFFGILWLDRRRRTRGRVANLREAVRDVTREAGEQGVPVHDAPGEAGPGGWAPDEAAPPAADTGPGTRTENEGLARPDRPD